MKILYSVQATGNGHISRAKDVVPHLQEHGQVDVFLSGSNAHLNVQLPVKYKSKGLSLFYNSHGGLNYPAILNNANPFRIYKEARQLPVEDYDIVINDYECITSLACRMKHKPSIHFGHQASYASSKVPRPEKMDRIGEFVLKNYAVASKNIGLHFLSYDENIYTPVLREEIVHGKSSFSDKIVVYLSQYSLEKQLSFFSKFPQFQFEIFSKNTKEIYTTKNITAFPINGELFTEKLLQCRGIITGAGFETPAEALFLGKGLLVIPIHAQYEQLCNAEALKEWKVPSVHKLEDLSVEVLSEWYQNSETRRFDLTFSNREIVSKVVESALLFH